MKIFYFTGGIDIGYAKDGSKQHIEGIVRGFHKLGWKITLFSSLVGKKDEQPDFPFQHLLTKKKDFSLSSQIREQVKLFWQLLIHGHANNKPDIIYIRSAYTFVIPVFFALWYKIPFFWEINALAELESSNKRLLPYAVKLENWVLKRAQGVFLVSEDLKEYFIKRSGLPSDKFTVIPNACDDAVIHSKCCLEKPDPQRQQTVGFVGTFQPRQGVETLIRAVSLVKKEIPNILLRIAGSGPCAEEYQKFVRHLNIEHNVEFIGFIGGHQIPSFLEPCGVTVAPYTAKAGESLISPLKVYTYLGSGKIVVVSALSAFKRDFGDCPAVIFAEPGNPASFARVIVMVLKLDEARRSELGSLGRQYVLENHTWSKMAEKTADAIINWTEIPKPAKRKKSTFSIKVQKF